MDWYIQDYGLSPQELEDKYSKYDYHPGYPTQAWRRAQTKLPYWQWVFNCLADEQDELDRDNPFNCMGFE